MKIKLTRATVGKISLQCTQFVWLWSVSLCLIFKLDAFSHYLCLPWRNPWFRFLNFCTRLMHLYQSIPEGVLDFMTHFMFGSHGSLTLSKPEVDNCEGWGVATFLSQTLCWGRTAGMEGRVHPNSLPGGLKGGSKGIWEDSKGFLVGSKRFTGADFWPR